MTNKRLKKLLMGRGFQRDVAEWICCANIKNCVTGNLLTNEEKITEMRIDLKLEKELPRLRLIKNKEA